MKNYLDQLALSSIDRDSFGRKVKNRLLIIGTDYSSERISKQLYENICKAQFAFSDVLCFESLMPIPLLSADWSPNLIAVFPRILETLTSESVRFVCVLGDCEVGNFGYQNFMVYGTYGNQLSDALLGAIGLNFDVSFVEVSLTKDLPMCNKSTQHPIGSSVFIEYEKS